MFQLMMTFLGGLAAILVADAIRRWWPFKWWLALGYWFNAQAWGGRDDTLIWVQPSCWSRVLPAPVCRLLASFFLLKVEAPPESEEKDHWITRERVVQGLGKLEAHHLGITQP